MRTGTGATKTLTVRDVQAIREAVPLIKSVSPNVDGRVQVIYGNQNWSTSYRGVSPEYLAHPPLDGRAGRLLHPART